MDTIQIHTRNTAELDENKYPLGSIQGENINTCMLHL
jgi:hypothetical protein